MVRPYGSDARLELSPFVPRSACRVLDVGCGAGAFGTTLRKILPWAEIVGVEPDADYADEAQPHYDEVIRASYPHEIPGNQRWDVVVFNDVLEHMADPWEALRVTRDNLHPGGTVLASIPNIRFLPIVWQLAVRGEWTYTDRGTLDRTHLRFFTKRSMIELFERTGYRVSAVTGIYSVIGRQWSWIRYAPTRFNEMQWQRFIVVAEPK